MLHCNVQQCGGHVARYCSPPWHSLSASNTQCSHRPGTETCFTASRFTLYASSHLLCRLRPLFLFLRLYRYRIEGSKLGCVKRLEELAPAIRPRDIRTTTESGMTIQRLIPAYASPPQVSFSCEICMSRNLHHTSVVTQGSRKWSRR
jgi:hypothetical protein